MSDSAHWEVGRNMPSDWDWIHNRISREANREIQGFGAMGQGEANAAIDFIVSLVHYIGELQAELIAMRTTLDAVGGEGWHDGEPTH